MALLDLRGNTGRFAPPRKGAGLPAGMSICLGAAASGPGAMLVVISGAAGKAKSAAGS